MNDFEAAASGDTQAILGFLPDEASMIAPEVVPEDITISAVDTPAPIVADMPPAFSSWLHWQCMDPKIENNSEVQVA
jgi:hypothetical protein